MKKKFLTAEWRKLAMANYAIDKTVLNNYLPYKTEIDTFNDTCYVSLIGFMFLNTKLKGIRIPFHSNFEEVNLRFYVRYKDGQEWKRGVVFIKEIVPKPALTFVANTIYNEKYETMPMRNSWLTKDNTLEVSYQWKKKNWNSFRVKSEIEPIDMQEGSEEEFITEHFWGYTFHTKTKTSEYGVEHQRWKVYPIKDYAIDVDFENIYGPDFKFLQEMKPVSVFLAEGSEIVVREGTNI